jgi:hypothetical protein
MAQDRVPSVASSEDLLRSSDNTLSKRGLTTNRSNRATLLFASIAVGLLAGVLAASLYVKFVRGDHQTAGIELVRVNMQNPITHDEAKPAEEAVTVAQKQAAADEPLGKEITLVSDNPTLAAAAMFEHAEKRPIRVGAGQALFLAASQRAYAPDYVNPASEEALFRTEHPVSGMGDLKLVDQAAGRYSSQLNKLQWQGQWSFNNPGRNVQLGAAYTEYLEEKLGKGMVSSLVSFEPEPAKLLEHLDGGMAKLGGIKSYVE